MSTNYDKNQSVTGMNQPPPGAPMGSMPPTSALPPSTPRRSNLPILLIGLGALCVLAIVCVVAAGLILASGPFAALASRTATPSPAPTSTRVPASPTANVGSGFITNVVMATGATGDNFDPTGVTDKFPPSATFHAIVTIENAPTNTSYRAVWYVEDAGSAAPANTKIDEYTLTTDGSRNLDFTLKPNSTWPVGKYRVEIWVNGKLARTVKFSVVKS